MAHYEIQQAASLLSVSAGTLRRWEKEKKVPPARRLRRTKHRIYTEELIAQIREYAEALIPAEQWLKERKRKRA